MQFLEDNEIWEWCRERGIALDKPSRYKRSLPKPYGTTTEKQHIVYAEGKRSGREASVAATVSDALGDWEECLLWITQVDAWPSSEDWPHYYSLRGQHGERRSLDTAPGHLFVPTERTLLTAFLTAVLENGWDAFVLPAAHGRANFLRAFLSHDEWVEIQTGR